MQKRLISLVVVTIIIVFLLYIRNGKSDKKWTVYGTMGCGWTRKQLEYMKTKGLPHTFVDCDKNECANMDAFPTTKLPNGKIVVGYKEF